MQAARKCVRCDALNDPGQLYCVKCGKYLSKEDKTSRKTTIWNMSVNQDNQILVDNTMTNIKESDDLHQYVVICPQCNSAVSADDGVIPLACDRCGYFFQAGIDKIVQYKPQKRQKSDFFDKGGRSTQPSSTSKKDVAMKTVPKKNNPMMGARRDESLLRLIVISKSGMVPESIKESGDIIGANGTVLKYIKTQQQVSVWHSPTGWYARTLQGQPLYNGVPVNVGMQIKLSDGDILTIEREQIRIEIVLETENGFESDS